MPLTLDEKEEMLEYACHEGNYGLANMLSAARVKEKVAAGTGRGGDHHRNDSRPRPESYRIGPEQRRTVSDRQQRRWKYHCRLLVTQPKEG
jgi:hypothetical protein